MLPLPIDPLLPEVTAELRASQRLVLAAPPGAGKTTRVPRALLDAGFAEGGEIVVLEPRRLAARLAARRVAEELGETLGETVGYQVRFEDISSAKTRIRFVTEGILTRKLTADPELRGVSAVLLDEFHERHLPGDLALALLVGMRRRLPIVVMSATLAAEPVAAFLGAKVLRSEGRLFDVAVEHLPQVDERPLGLQVASAVRRLVREESEGHVLVFLPGAGEIQRAEEACAPIAQEHGLLLVRLHGDLQPDAQDRAVRPGEQRKVILSTNVAESSVTIEGVRGVVDAGLARVASYAPWSGLPRLRTEKISRASATQRAGRAGRTGPGRCLRLYTRADFEARPAFDLPEVQRADLSQTMLELSAAGISKLRWFEPPPESQLRAAAELLEALGATAADGSITALGKRLARLGIHPRQARIAIEGEDRGVPEDAAVVAALLGERDIRLSQRTRFAPGSRAHAGATERSDVVALLDVFREAKEQRFAAHALRAIGLDPGVVFAVDRAAKDLARRLGSRASGPRDEEMELEKCILAGYPDRVATRLRPGARALAIAGGRAGELAESSAVRDAPWMVAVDAEDAPRKSGVLVRLASAIEPDWLIDLFPEAVKETHAVEWDLARTRVRAVERLEFGGLTLHQNESDTAAPEDAARVLATAALAAGPRAFVAEDALDRWLARVRFAATVDPRVHAPSDAEVRDALTALCEGRRSFAELREASLLGALSVRLGPPSAAEALRLAPERVQLAAGRTAQVTYEDGKPPWAESYLQDFFGMKDTPKIGGGKVALVVHLWAPNKRAVQVTRDLAGFWSRHYPAIRKELMRKYPKHSWPEDPTVIAPRYKREAR